MPSQFFAQNNKSNGDEDKKPIRSPSDKEDVYLLKWMFEKRKNETGTKNVENENEKIPGCNS